LPKRSPKQWDVWFADLRPGLKREQTGKHNVLIVSDDLLTTQSGVVLVAPITSSGQENPWVIEIEPADAGIDLRSWIECHQLQTISASRLIEFRRALSFSKRPYVLTALRSVLRGAIESPGLSKA
jgi:mRNA-degrading endonuclease toxin of MazEF toxin-antitoxin module